MKKARTSHDIIKKLTFFDVAFSFALQLAIISVTGTINMAG